MALMLVSDVEAVPAGGRAWQGIQGVRKMNSKGGYKNCIPSLAETRPSPLQRAPRSTSARERRGAVKWGGGRK